MRTVSQCTVGRESTSQRVSVWGEETSKRKGLEGVVGALCGVGRACVRVVRMVRRAKRRTNAGVVIERAIVVVVVLVCCGVVVWKRKRKRSERARG
jgi:hypothetical protein